MTRKSANFLASCLASTVALCTVPGVASAAFIQTNLVSDIAGNAPTTDANLKNPWGIAFSPTGVAWVSDQATNVSTLYSSAGVRNTLIVAVPGGPTGQVFNSAGAGNFLDGGSPANFIFDTLSGSIYAWNAANGTTAQAEASVGGASFTGLALDTDSTGHAFLYAADSTPGTGGVDVFNSSFAKAVLPGNFVDPNLPATYVPYNIQNINGKLYVVYTNTANARALGSGAVSVFDASGNLLQELIGPGGQLDDPWGVTLAPANFGNFGGDLLVGNFGNGEINAFDPSTGAFLGALTDSTGAPIVNQDLWALSVSPTVPNAVFFTAGINRQQDGLFGEITAAPEPGSVALGFLGCVALTWVARRKRSASRSL